MQGETLHWRSLGRTVLVVAVVSDKDWRAYIGPVEGKNHDNEADAVVYQGYRLDEKIARAVFPLLDRLPYDR